MSEARWQTVPDSKSSCTEVCLLYRIFFNSQCLRWKRYRDIDSSWHPIGPSNLKVHRGPKAQIPAPIVIRWPTVSPFRQRIYSVAVERRGSGSPVRKLLRRLGWYSFTQFAVAANAWRHGASCCCCWRWWRWCVVMRRERWHGRAVMDSCRLHVKECPTCRLSGIGNCDFTMTCKLPVHTTIHVCRGMQCVYANLLPE